MLKIRRLYLDMNYFSSVCCVCFGKVYIEVIVIDSTVCGTRHFPSLPSNFASLCIVIKRGARKLCSDWMEVPVVDHECKFRLSSTLKSHLYYFLNDLNIILFGAHSQAEYTSLPLMRSKFKAHHLFQ